MRLEVKVVGTSDESDPYRFTVNGEQKTLVPGDEVTTFTIAAWR